MVGSSPYSREGAAGRVTFRPLATPFRMQEALGSPDAPEPTDEQLLVRVRAGDVDRFEVLMRRYNQRLYRAARAIVRDDAEAEDVVQDAWVRAFSHLGQFEGRASVATWLTRIAVHEALARVRQNGRRAPLEEAAPALVMTAQGPEQQAADREVGRLLERAVDALPDGCRAAFVFREIEGLSTADTAAALDISEESVKTRLHRARRQLRRTLYDDAFRFLGARCDRTVAAVMARIRRIAG